MMIVHPHLSGYLSRDQIIMYVRLELNTTMHIENDQRVTFCLCILCIYSKYIRLYLMAELNGPP